MTTKPANGQRADVDRTRDALLKLGLDHAAERLTELMSVAVKENYPPHRMLDELLGIESDRREERRVKTSLVLSGLPVGQSIDNFDWSFQPAIDRKQISEIVFGGATTVAGNTFITPLSKPWHNPNVPNPAPSVDKAREILKSAGYTWNAEGKLVYPK